MQIKQTKKFSEKSFEEKEEMPVTQTINKYKIPKIYEIRMIEKRKHSTFQNVTGPKR